MMENLPIDPQKLCEYMERISNIHDQEYSHRLADRFICMLLTSLGYGKAVEVFKDMSKWYA
jgi:hypothetical protein